MNSSQILSIPAALLACLLVVACGDSDREPGVSQSVPSSAVSGAAAANSGAVTDGAVAPPATSAGNQPPQISGGTPPEATVGQFWAYEPDVADPDGDRLTVTASNLPAWITLNSETGRLSGTPEESDIRTWTGISLTVSDGRTSVTLPDFALTVVDENAGVGSVTLSWLPPTQNVDGSPLGGLSGYRLLYGQASGAYTETVNIDNPGITTFMVEGLTTGDWFFAIQTVDSDGLISEPSAEARARI